MLFNYNLLNHTLCHPLDNRFNLLSAHTLGSLGSYALQLLLTSLLLDIYRLFRLLLWRIRLNLNLFFRLLFSILVLRLYPDLFTQSLCLLVTTTLLLTTATTNIVRIEHIFALPILILNIDHSEAVLYADCNPNSVSQHPLHSQRPNTTLYVGCNIRTHNQADISLAVVLCQQRYLILDSAVERCCRLDLSCSSTRRTNILNRLNNYGTKSLASNLHQTKFGQWQNRVASLVGSHQALHLVVEHLSALLTLHIYKVNNDDTPQVAQTHLTCDFGCGSKVDFKYRLFVIIIRLCSIARIDIDDVHRLCRFDHQIGSASKRNVAGKERFYLARDVEIVENRHRTAIEFDNLILRRIN